MVDTNQDVLPSEAAVKKSKEAPKNAPAKAKATSPSKTPAAKGQTGDNIKKFFKGAWAELKKVHWPSRQELINYTLVVLVTVIIISAIIFAVDSLLSKVLDIIIPK